VAKITTREAAELTGKSRVTIWRACKKGTVSANRGDDGEFLVDVSELERVYGPLKQAKPLHPPLEKPDATAENRSETMVLQAELKALRDQVHELKADKEDLRQERDRLLAVLKEQAGSMKLLTDQRSVAPRGFFARLFGR